MDKNIIWIIYYVINIYIMTAVCIIGSYDNEANRPEEFRGRFAEEIKQYRHPRNKAQPHYLRNYGNIKSGTKYRLYRNVYNPILLYRTLWNKLTLQFSLKFLGKQSEGLDTSLPTAAEKDSQQEATTAQFNIHENIGVSTIPQQNHGQFNAAGNILILQC